MNTARAIKMFDADTLAIVAKTLSGYMVVVVLMAWIRNETFLEGLIDRLEKELSK